MSVNFVVMIFAKIGSAGEISSNQSSKNFLFGTTDDDGDQDSGGEYGNGNDGDEDVDDDLKATQLLGAPIEVSWSSQVSQPLPDHLSPLRNLAFTILFT